MTHHALADRLSKSCLKWYYPTISGLSDKQWNLLQYVPRKSLPESWNLNFFFWYYHDEFTYVWQYVQQYMWSSITHLYLTKKNNPHTTAKVKLLLLWLKRLNAIYSHDLPEAQPNSRALQGTSFMTWSPFEFGRERKRYRPPWCQRVFKHLSFYFSKKQTQLTCSFNTFYLQQRAMNVLGIHKSRLEFHLGGVAW